MLQSALVIVLLSALLAFLTIFSMRRLRRTENQLKEKNKELERRLYELSVSQSVSQQIGYSLNLRTIINSIIETASHIIPHSAISYALIEGNTIDYKIFEKDFIGPNFLQSFKVNTIDLLKNKIKDLSSYEVIESNQKEIPFSQTAYNNSAPKSFFGIPLLVNERCVGAVSIASTHEDEFSEEDKELIRRTIENTLETVGKLESVIKTEKAKLDSFLFSVSSGALLFLIEGDILKLSAINMAAKQFLHVKNNPDTTEVIAHFGLHHDLIQDIRDVARDRKSTLLKNVSIYDRTFKIYLNPVFLSTKEIIGVAITMDDITFERDIEEMRETFTNMVVHELRAPLSSIKGASQMLIDGKLKREDTVKMLHIVHDSTDRMLTDIGDILDVAKLEAGKFTLNKTLGSINEMVSEKATAFSYMAQERNIKIQQNLDSSIPEIAMDQQRIGQVLNNLFSNALKFTPDGGTITATTTAQNGQITVSVHDNGVGVPEEKKALLFSKYGQISGSVRHEGGTGLGLYISKGIIDSHGGKIWLDSQPGKGTTVAFTLPIITKVEGEGAEPSRKEKEESQTSTAKLLKRVVN